MTAVEAGSSRAGAGGEMEAADARRAFIHAPQPMPSATATETA